MYRHDVILVGLMSLKGLQQQGTNAGKWLFVYNSRYLFVEP